MLIQIDESASLPLFSQIAGQVRHAIADGSLRVGDRLAPARELAASLGVNMHTVLRAYQELRDEGLVEMRRGRGVTVSAAAPDVAPLVELATAYIAAARRRGMTDDAVVAHLKELL
ncbi:GntR family transcriptional regulator [Actinomarinicola tropica]|uniref:GntR family transcriptional regulator n=1 Tax=Actinomarinicola tropica TaxID=2789776 RepID=A0A5Q2RF13_9ACTN|nr:GntR family transcriptional regulator [Actinomarinicola tropica]QGG94263.1 GntR family transcriptional regulator [Actinomarinicola tropica]